MEEPGMQPRDPCLPWHGRCDLSPPPSLPIGFLGVQLVPLLRRAMCLFWGADLWLQPSRQMSTIQNPQKSWLSSRAAPGKSGLHARGEGERVMALALELLRGSQAPRRAVSACGCPSCSGRRGVAGTLLGKSPGVGMSELAGEKIGIIIPRRKSVS